MKAARHRIDGIRNRFHELDLDGFLSTKFVNTYYLSGFTSLDTLRPASYTRPIMVFIGADDDSLIIPRLDEEDAEQVSATRSLHTYDQAPARMAAIRAAAERILDAKVHRLGIEEDALTYNTIADLRDALPGVELVPAAGLIEDARAVKDSSEITLLEGAAVLSKFALQASMAACTPGVAELLMEMKGTQAMRNAAVDLFGGDVFVDSIPIVLTGPRTSQAHGFTSARIAMAGDPSWHCWLVSHRGYWVENIRSMSVGDDSPLVAELGDTVNGAREAGIAAARPGVAAGSVFNAVRTVLLESGLPTSNLLDRSGHGTGLEYHEPPFFEAGASTILRPGMVVTIEPGLWLPGRGGVTTSDTILITDGDPRRLTMGPDDVTGQVQSL